MPAQNFDPANAPAVTKGDIILVTVPKQVAEVDAEPQFTTWAYTALESAPAGWGSLNAKRPNGNLRSGYEAATLSLSFARPDETYTHVRAPQPENAVEEA